MTQEIRPGWIVGSPLEGAIAYDTLREHGIKCDCVELSSEHARTSPTRHISAPSDTGSELTVIVAPEDVERAHQILEQYTDLP